RMTAEGVDVDPLFETVKLTPGFLQSNQFVIDVPPQLRGKVVTLQITSLNAEEIVEDFNAWSFPEIDGEAIENKVLFEPDERTIAQISDSPAQLAALQQQAQWIFDHPDSQVQFFGYADPIGTIEYNRQLALDRATAVTHYVRQFLVDRGQSAARVLDPVSIGEVTAVAIPGGTSASYTLERRTEMRVRERVTIVSESDPTDPAYAAGEEISQVFFLDGVRFSLVTSGDPMELDPQGAVPQGAPVSTLAQMQDVIDAAKQAWLDNGVYANLDNVFAGITFEVRDLGDNALASFDDGLLTIDDDASGFGWFIDLSPADSSEYTAGGKAHLFEALSGSGAQGRVDLLTVVMHELGHAVGLEDIAATLEPRLMSATLRLGERRVYSELDAAPAPAVPTTPAADPMVLLTGAALPASGSGVQTFSTLSASGAPVTSALTNGDFVAATGWTASGGGVVSGGVGVLAEDSRFLSSLQQGFAVPAGADSITLRIASASLGSNAALPPDAFEIALLDPVTGASLLGAMGGLSLSDALLNLQADGSLYLAPGVTVQGNPLTGAAIVTISLAGVDTSNGAWLSFDLIGQGALDSLVTVDDVGFGGAINSPPVARDDDAVVAEDGEVAIDLLSNDSDVDGDPLAVTILTAPANGTLRAPTTPGDAWTYVPDANFSGTDSFTYQISDNINPPATATARITVSAVNDTPEITPVANRSATVGEAIALAIAASDIEDAAQDLVFTLLEGPQGLTLSPQGQLQWTAAGSGQQTVRLRVTDSGGASAETSFVIAVTPANNEAPQIAAVAAQQVDEGASLSFALSATDADHAAGDLVYSLVTGPAGATVSPAGQFNWIATDQAAQQPVTVRVTDPAGAFTETSFVINVALAPDNLAPVPNAVANRTVTAGGVLIVPLSATDDLDAPNDLVWSLSPARKDRPSRPLASSAGWRAKRSAHRTWSCA
ncbi:MAG: hypothetical protein B7Y74_02345, partial [Novosphingobium sp. 35-62-5]